MYDKLHDLTLLVMYGDAYRALNPSTRTLLKATAKMYGLGEWEMFLIFRPAVYRENRSLHKLSALVNGRQRSTHRMGYGSKEPATVGKKLWEIILYNKGHLPHPPQPCYHDVQATYLAFRPTTNISSSSHDKAEDDNFDPGEEVEKDAGCNGVGAVVPAKRPG
jgi:hypothetical protein